MLREAFGEHSLRHRAVFKWHSCFKASQMSVEDDEHSGRASTNKTTENIEQFENSSTKIFADQSMSSQTPLGYYGVCQEILKENLNVRRTAPSSRQCAHSHSPKNHTAFY
jgi:hypothetical protein